MPQKLECVCGSCEHEWTVDPFDASKIAEGAKHDLYLVDPSDPNGVETSWRKCSSCGEMENITSSLVTY
jgi:hypothetical protein